MKKIILIIIVLGVAGYWFLGRDDAPSGDVTELNPEAVILSGTAQLSAVGDYTGEGVAGRQWDGTTFVHAVTAVLGAPADGTFYEGWLVRPDPFEFISTGKLSAGDDGYGLTFSMDRDLTGHTNIVITEETEANGLDGVPEAHVLEGAF
jgi:hypothetical protein